MHPNNVLEQSDNDKGGNCDIWTVPKKKEGAKKGENCGPVSNFCS